ncbi:hypothetical protein CNMCM8980_009670 [Aspergillus fumigatiaffinis]|nr:hypothetical protein CNMCM6457_002436 [Aspergillus fumigatiaffinis]KAF4221225.1 hypothetical protein CNMCM5878_010022 [Aspergillus fumigatiaffinis]KAF4245439.1 hypothetical protein CNMCM8980_009670 [Aspergillus fumigatiaffinis]
MDFHPSELPSEGDLFEFERFDKGYDAEDICCVVCGAPSFVVEAEVRNKNLERYKWFVPQAIRAENYHYEKDWDIASLPNHDLPLEVLGIDEIEIDGVHYGERLSRLEPVSYWEHSSKLVHDLYTEYPVHFDYPLGRNGSFHPRRAVEPHFYYFRDTNLFRNVAWAWGDQKVYEYEMAPYPIPGLTQEILSYLRPLPPSLQGQSALSLKLEALPTELQDIIYKNLHPFINPEQTCTRCLPSRLWRDLLFNRQILPWLWDLDISALQSCPVTSDAADVATFEAEEVWDWERLVRTLAQVEVFEPGHPLEHAPLRLRNRRRIWRLLEEAEDEDIEEWLDAHVYKRK